MGEEFDWGEFLGSLFDNTSNDSTGSSVDEFLNALGFGSSEGGGGGAAPTGDTSGLSSLFAGAGGYETPTLSATGANNSFANVVSQQQNANKDDLWNNVSGWLSKLSQGDKETTGQAKMGIGTLGLLSSLYNSRKYAKQGRNQLTPEQLQAMLRSPYSSWTPGQQTAFNNYFYQPLPQFTYQRPQTFAPRGYAHGGSTSCGCLNRLAAGGQPQNFVSQGAGGGQGDQVEARLSPGEYVIDADVVSALGDGDNATGAQMLDQMREAIRQHKRSAPPDSIPPPARSPLAYLKG